MHVIPEWLELISLAFCAGVVACRLWFFTTETQTGFGHPANFVSGMWTLFCYGLAVLMIGSVVELMVRTAEISGQPYPGFFAALPTVLFKTHYGRVWLVRVGAVSLLMLSKTITRYRDSRTFLIFMLLLVLIVSLTASASGHASDAGDFSIPEIMDWFHLLAACFWGGGLMVLSVSVLPDIIGKKERSAPLIASVASRFSMMAGVAVGVTAVTALYNLWYYVRIAEALWKTSYGLTVIAKIILFFILVNLGAFNRYVSVPLLREWADGVPVRQGIINRIAGVFLGRFLRNRNSDQIAMRFRRSVRVEAVLIVGVLFCAALLRHEIPARHLSHMQHGGKGAVHQMHEMQDGGNPPTHSDHNLH